MYTVLTVVLSYLAYSNWVSWQQFDFTGWLALAIISPIIAVALLLVAASCFSYLAAIGKKPALVLWPWGFEYQLDLPVARRRGVVWSEVTDVRWRTYSWRGMPVIACALRDPENVNVAAVPSDSLWNATKRSRRRIGVMINLLAFNIQDRPVIANLMWQSYVAYQQRPGLGAPVNLVAPRDYSAASMASPI